MRQLFYALYLPAVLFSAAGLGMQAQAWEPQPGDSAVASGDDPDQAQITVTGNREERPRYFGSGSRIARDEVPRPFSSIATQTGVNGLVPGSGMDPFAGATRTIRDLTCRSDDSRISPSVACRLVPIQQLIASGSYDQARALLDRLISSEDASDEERYIAARIWYQVGELSRDDGDRENALLAMLATASMPQNERIAALRTLVSMALRRGENEPVVPLLEQIVSIAPYDAQSRANLATLYAQNGRVEEAADLIGHAIALMRANGANVPNDWLRFAASHGARN